jgi:hypothetical protein
MCQGWRTGWVGGCLRPLKIFVVASLESLKTDGFPENKDKISRKFKIWASIDVFYEFNP